jgi:hypothetical protein
VSARATARAWSTARRLLMSFDMVVPERDWLLLRGRLRAFASIAALPVLFADEGDDDDDTPDAEGEDPR